LLHEFAVNISCFQFSNFITSCLPDSLHASSNYSVACFSLLYWDWCLHNLYVRGSRNLYKSCHWWPTCDLRWSVQWGTGYPVCEFVWFFQALQAISGVVPQIRPKPLPSTSFPVHYSLILSFSAIFPSCWECVGMTYKLEPGEPWL
jgi:hypothetical protein